MSEGHDSSTDQPTPGSQPPQPGGSSWAAPGGEPAHPQGPGGGPYQGGPQPPPPGGYGGYGAGGGYPGAPGGPGGYPGGGYGAGRPEMRPGIIPLRPLAVGEILDGALRLIRSSPRAALGLAAGAAVIGTLPLAIVQALEANEAFSSLFGEDASVRPPAGILPSVSEVIADAAGVLVQFLLVTVLTGVLTQILGRAVFGGRITAGEAWQRSKGRIPALLGTAVLTGLILAAPALVLITLIFFALGAAEIGLFFLLSLGGTVALICYVAFFGTRLALAAPAVVLERLGVIAALRRSWELTRGAFWRVFGVIVLTNIIVAVVTLVIGIPFGLMASAILFATDGGSGATPVLVTLSVLSEMCAAIITYPLQAGVLGLLYTDRRMRAEAFDLVLQSAAADQYRLGWVPASADELWLRPAGGGPHGGA